MTQSSEADVFVLKSVGYGDSNLIVTLLAREHGMFSAMARSAKKSRKRFPGGLLPLRLLKAHVRFSPNKNLATLQETEVVRDFAGIETSYDKITIASYATELVRASLRDNDPADAVFELLSAFYTGLAEADDDLPIVRAMLLHFELSLLGAVGMAPAVDSCHRCGLVVDDMDIARCDRGGHGLVCADCVRRGERHGVLSAETVAVLRWLQTPQGRPPDGIAQPEVAAQVRRVLDASLAHLVVGELKSRSLIDAIFTAEK